jgi:molybdate transport system regulatory protein
MSGDLTVRFRVDFGCECSIGIGKIELLEGIARTGSLSEAARQMRVSYRRAWLLLADLNASFDEPVARASTGGRGGGGAVLTPFGERLIAAYRRMETRLQPLTGSYFQEFGKHVKITDAAARTKKLLPVASVKRSASTHLKFARKT